MGRLEGAVAGQLQVLVRQRRLPAEWLALYDSQVLPIDCGRMYRNRGRNDLFQQLLLVRIDAHPEKKTSDPPGDVEEFVVLDYPVFLLVGPVCGLVQEHIAHCGTAKNRTTVRWKIRGVFNWA